MERRATPFSAALSQSIERQHLTLKVVRRGMANRGSPVSMATLSYWRSGQRQPEGPRSHEAVAALESVLGMRPGNLSSLLGPSRRPGPDFVTAFDEQVGAPDVGRMARGELGIHDPDALSPRSHHLVVQVDIDGWVVRTTMRTTWRARADGVQRTAVYLKTDDPTLEPPEVVAVAGCTIGSRSYDQNTGLVTAVLDLPTAINIGGTVMTEHAFVGRMSAERERHFELFATRRTNESGLTVQFDPARVPASCEYEVIDECSHIKHPLQLTDGTIAHVVERFGPGSLRLCWEWND